MMTRKIILLPLMLLGLLAVPQLAGAQEHATGALRLPPGELVAVEQTPAYRDFIPGAVDLSSYFPRVGDQQQQGSCVSWAVGFAARAYYGRMIENRDNDDFSNVPSPAFIYNATHEPNPPDRPCSIGSYTTNVLTLLQTRGAPSLADFPYDPSSCPPLTAAQKAMGTGFKIDSFQRVGDWDPETGAPYPSTIDAMKAELAQGNPVIIGVNIDTPFQSMHGPAGLSIWEAGEAAPDSEWQGHEITVVGYDDAQQTFKFLNSWGSEWGDNGFGRMTYETFLHRGGEAFVIRMPGDPEVPLQQADFRPDVITQDPMLRTESNVGAAAPGAVVGVDGLWCGQVDVSGKPGEARTANGFVSSPEALAALKTELGEGVDTSWVEVAPWPLCETRLALAAALASDSMPEVKMASAADGGRLVNIGASDAHLYVVSYAADGSARVAEAAAGSDQAIDADAQSVFVIASERPLLSPTAGTVPARDFLNSLRAGVQIGDAGNIGARFVALQ